jgi:hypothetical protein
LALMTKRVGVTLRLQRVCNRTSLINREKAIDLEVEFHDPIASSACERIMDTPQAWAHLPTE